MSRWLAWYKARGTTCHRIHYFNEETLMRCEKKTLKKFFKGLKTSLRRPSSEGSISHTLFEKSNFCPKIQFWQNPNVFESFLPKFFLTIFLVKSKLSTAKKSKTTTFSWVFYPKKSTIFLGKSKLNFWTKNEDFEQWIKPSSN